MTDLPQLPSPVAGRDLAAAAQLIRRVAGPVSGSFRNPLALAGPAEVDELRHTAAALPALPPAVVDELVHDASGRPHDVDTLAPLLDLANLPADQRAEVEAHADQLADDQGIKCQCRPRVICDEDTCGYCRTLDPALPCPADTLHADIDVGAAAPSCDDQQHIAAGYHATSSCTAPVDELPAWIAADVGEVVPAAVVTGDAPALDQPAENLERSQNGNGDGDVGRTLVEVAADVVDLRAAAAADFRRRFDLAPAHTADELLVPGTGPRPGTGHLPTLDWSSRHDVRSLAYGAADAGVARPVTLADVDLPAGPVLDQGGEGACVGFGIVDALNAMRTTRLTADDARRLYRRAQQLDDRPGEAYTGTSVLAGMKAAVEAGLIGSYLWCFGTRDIAQTVMRRHAVVVGLPWLAGMFDTDAGGLVDLTGGDIGIGHCLAIVGLRLRGPQGQPGPYFVWQNSIGPSYGDGGLGYIHHRDLAQLLRGQGEAAVPMIDELT